MNTQDIIKILRQHNSAIEEITLEKSKNLSDVWETYIHTVYHNAQIEKLFWDEKLKETLSNFGENESLDLVTKKGKILKRFAHFHKTETGEGIPDNVMGILGDILQSLVTAENSLRFFVDFTDSFDWNDGEFGNKGSCWWGKYSDSLPTFQGGGGWCIRFYDENKNGIGRTWLYPDPEENVLLGFNSYGVERAKVSKVIKKIFLSHSIELHYATCRIENSHSSNIPYINGGTGFVLYAEGDSPQSDYDLDMEIEEDEEHENCHNCSSRINTNSDYYNVVGDYIYCQDCTDELFSYCSKCDEFCDNDEVHKVTDSHSRYDYLCEYCANSVGMILCSDCGEWTEYGIEAYDSGNIFCESCNNTFFCEKCENYFENSSECPDCTEEEETEPDTNLKDKFPGLIVSPQFVKFGKAKKEVNTYRYENIPGLMVCKNEKWMVYHINTQLTVMAEIKSFEYAIEAMEKFGELTNWSLYHSPAQISNDEELCEKAKEVQFYIRRNME